MNTSRKILAIAAGLLGLVTAASANTLVLNTNPYSNGSNGGSYTISNFGTGLTTSSYSNKVSTATSFETFCMEPTEYFSPGSTYDYTLAPYAFGGANEAASRNIGTGDHLSKGTSYLYSQFAQGILSGYTYTLSTAKKTSNLYLQQAFWYLEDDYTLTGSQAMSNTFLVQVAQLFGGGTITSSNILSKLEYARANAADGAYGVWAVNVTSNHGQTQNQSQLYYHNVPEAASTVALLGLALLGLVGLRRKSAK